MSQVQVESEDVSEFIPEFDDQRKDTFNNDSAVNLNGATKQMARKSDIVKQNGTGMQLYGEEVL